MNVKHYDLIQIMDRASFGLGVGAPHKHDLYLSPHCDDVAFSLGQHATDAGKGRLLVLFSRSTYMMNKKQRADEKIDGLAPEDKIAAVSKIRCNEERAFAAKVGMEVTFADLDDAPVRGRETADTEPAPDDSTRFLGRLSDDETGRLAARIMDQIRHPAVGGSGRKPTLYCPAGIGRHLDHLVVRNTVIRHLSELKGTYGIAFYEELRYSSDRHAREDGLRDLFIQLRPTLPWRHIVTLPDPAKKLELVNMYPSQFDKPVQELREFTPGTRVSGAAPHEALWLL